MVSTRDIRVGLFAAWRRIRRRAGTLVFLLHHATRRQGIRGLLRATWRFVRMRIPGRLGRGATRDRDTTGAFLHSLYKASKFQWGRQEYVPYSEQGLDAVRLKLRAIAYYLPQFHPIPENDNWWGRGFTEWSNVTRAVPQFLGHYQPHLPADLGFYDLRLFSNMHKQAELAAHYGLAGFCLYYYWFAGKRLLTVPLQHIMSNRDLNMPFCLCWANESWTRRWDGQEDDVLVGQSYSPEDDLALIAELSRCFVDPRYIRVNGKPIFLVYCPLHLPDPSATVARWRKYCRDHGIGELYLVAVESFRRIDPKQYSFDASCQFPPHQALIQEINYKIDILNEDYRGSIFDFRELIDFFVLQPELRYVRLSGVATSWDNEPRKPGKGHTFIHATPETYARWLDAACRRTLNQVPEGERIVFINAWNEWAEGAHLEPDRRFGHAYLHATASVLSQFVAMEPWLEHRFTASRENFVKTAKVAIICHLYYRDLLDELLSLLAQTSISFDLFITLASDVPTEWADRLIVSLPQAYILPVHNRGRDILPFYQLLPLVQQLGYTTACKLHTKKSPQLSKGSDWRTRLWQGLLGAGAASRAQEKFEADPRLGLLAVQGSLLNLAEPDTNIDNRSWLDLLMPRLDAEHLPGDYRVKFPAGSMFWFRPAALPTLADLGLSEDTFEPELGQIDGTLAHALERLVGLAVVARGYKVDSLSLLRDRDSFEAPWKAGLG